MRVWTKKLWTFRQKSGAFEKKFPIFLSKFTTSGMAVKELSRLRPELEWMYANQNVSLHCRKKKIAPRQVVVEGRLFILFCLGQYLGE